MCAPSAASVAVRDARRKRRNVELHAGAGTADSAHWNKAMTDFQGRTEKNIPGVTQIREQPGSQFINPARCDLKANRAAAAPPAASTRHYEVAVLGASAQPLASPLRHCRILEGLHRCAEAELVVVPDLTLLHDEDALAGDVDLAVSFLYVVALGVDITTRANLAAAPEKHTPRSLTPEHCVRHIPAIKSDSKVRFCLGPALDHDVRKALKRLTRKEGSCFSISTSAPGERDVFVGTVRDVVAWACSARRVAIEKGPKAVLADGRRLPA